MTDQLMTSWWSQTCLKFNVTVRLFFPCFDPYGLATAMFKEMNSEGQRVVERFFRGD